MNSVQNTHYTILVEFDFSEAVQRFNVDSALSELMELYYLNSNFK